MACDLTGNIPHHPHSDPSTRPAHPTPALYVYSPHLVGWKEYSLTSNGCPIR